MIGRKNYSWWKIVGDYDKLYYPQPGSMHNIKSNKNTHGKCKLYESVVLQHNLKQRKIQVLKCSLHVIHVKLLTVTDLALVRKDCVLANYDKLTSWEVL